MRSYAVIPPILLDERARKRRFTNSNGLIEEPMQEYKDKQFINLWTDQEKDIFKVISFCFTSATGQENINRLVQPNAF